jgi:hypothetical protein
MTKMRITREQALQNLDYYLAQSVAGERIVVSDETEQDSLTTTRTSGVRHWRDRTDLDASEPDYLYRVDAHSIQRVIDLQG